MTDGGAMQKNSTAIILKRIPYGDSDLIVTFFSREFGKMSGLAKSARASRKRFAGSLEPGMFVDVQFVERPSSELVRIDRADPLRPIDGMLRSIERINAMGRAVELASAFLQPHQVSESKFKLLDRYLLWLGENDPTPGTSLIFEFKWLMRCGFTPELSKCLMCDEGFASNRGWSFDLDHGGFVCSSCSSSVGDDAGVAADALRITALGEHRIERCAAEAAFAVLSRYSDHILGRPLKYRAL
ncbi:MAG: DNA repair protein RecO [bacterium ADurb.Bin270]|nr:MAG: DNA repair protein RecO [bacterium ADurb.Bin270]